MQDIQGHWAQPCIEVLLQKQVFTGYRDSTFRPNQAVTRAEFAAIAARAFDLPPRRESRLFLDLPPTHWAIAAIDRVYRAGWLSGYRDGTFRPSEPMPRVQVLVALAAGLELTPLHAPETLVKTALQDAAEVPSYAVPGLAAALENRLVVNYPQRRQLNPLRATTRAEMAAFIYQAIAYQTGIPSLLPETLIAGGSDIDLHPPKAELRGVWLTNVDSEVLFSRENLERGIARLADCHFNTLYPTVWNGGYTLFPSDVAEAVLGERQRLHPGLTRSPREAQQDGRDMLQECLEIAHAHHLRVIPWFEYGFFARKGNSLRQRRPHWFTLQRDGNPLDDHQMEWLNPFHPEVQDFFLRLIDDLMSRYEVDGFQIDDHFGLPVTFGYDPFTTQLYRAETGRLVPNDCQDAQWMRWRADKITQFVQQVCQTVKQRKPKAVFSVSPNPPEFSYTKFLQDWPQWLKLTTVDEVLIQTYRWNVPAFVNELRKPSVQALKAEVPISIGVLSGLKNRPMPLPILKQQCQAVRANGYAGMAFFFYETLWQTSGESPDLRQATLKALLQGK